jgi:UDP-N-acetyl-D-glucosamine/UDP-N-acetyl-D-galactosamine dehydrogenase
MHGRKISVIGLGYVGLPVAVAFSRLGPVVGFDISQRRIDELRRGHDRTGEVGEAALAAAPLRLTTRPEDLRTADFHIVTVPTPVDATRRPNLRPLMEASTLVARQLKAGDIVVYESTVYPGATEEICAPILERESGLMLGRDFAVGYSPERINPGDPHHRFETIAKIVSGGDAATLDIVARVYGSVVEAGIHRAPTIRTAEAAKVIENTQRDLNIALVNELALIFERLGVDTHDVLQAAGTKWNFLPFTPGLVGGHCIGVDPYYLTFKAEEVGYNPEVILAGRRINDRFGGHVAQQAIKALLTNGDHAAHDVTILGFTFKENVPDVRNTRIVDMVAEFQSYGVAVQIADALADPEEVAHEYGLNLTPLDDLKPASAVIFAVPHRAYCAGGWPLVRRLLRDGSGVVVDVKAALDRAATPDGVKLIRP